MNAQLPIQQYLDDQHALLELGLTAIERAVAARETTDARHRLAGFRAHFDRYVRNEERVLFPIYERLPSVAHEPIARMREEHGSLRRMIARVFATLDRRETARALELLGALRSVLLVHGAKEDWVIYPRVVDALPAAAQVSMMRALREGTRFA
jgi:iron-sulfur cluster repair protein YtfE (RIC family)